MHVMRSLLQRKSFPRGPDLRMAQEGMEVLHTQKAVQQAAVAVLPCYGRKA
jgi:hypothetical protein